jgi:hypothetical protein
MIPNTLFCIDNIHSLPVRQPQVVKLCVRFLGETLPWRDTTIREQAIQILIKRAIKLEQLLRLSPHVRVLLLDLLHCSSSISAFVSP